MADASTRAHVASPKTEQPIPVADLGTHQTSESSDADTDSAIEPTIPLSRKEKRKLKHKRHDSALSTPSDTDTESSHPGKPPNNPPKQQQQPTTDLSIPRALAPMAKNAAQKAYPLLICSIGNPGAAYANTLHSAGHILTSYIATRKSYLPFTKGLSGLVSRPDTSHLAFHSIMQGFRRTSGEPVSIDEDWTLWQSTSLMNVSGKGVQRAYAEWLRGIRAQYGDATLEGRLVVVHDELESALGKVTVRDGGASAKGHNGLKSCGASLGRTKWWRVGVGIGRPESREPAEVARYVLRKVTQRERAVLEDCAIKVADALEDIASGRK